MNPPGTILLIRHCLSTGQAPDAPLALQGSEAAVGLAGSLAELGVSALYSSPYVRARETLAPFSERAGLPITIDARLRERTLSSVDLPDWRDHIARSFTDRDHRAPGGESFNDVATRALAALSDIAAAGHALPAVATHGNFLSSLLHLVDPQFGFDDWLGLGNPDIFEARMDASGIISMRRVSF